MRELFDAPLVTSFHGHDLKVFGRWSPMVYGRLFSAGDAFVANSGYTKGCLARMGCPEAKIVRIPAILNDAGVKARDKVLDSGTPRLLTVARLVEPKGVQHCLRAVKALRSDGYHLKYTVVGDGPYRPQLESLAADLDIADIVCFAGVMRHEDVYRQYALSDICVLPSTPGTNGSEESQGLVIQEAQLHGLPVVASRIGGIPESVNNGEAGLLCEPGNPADLASKLRRLIDDRAFAESIAKTGTAYCRAKYARSTCVHQLAQLYRSLQ